MRVSGGIYDDPGMGTLGAARFTRTGRQSSSSNNMRDHQAYVTNDLDRPWDDLGGEEETQHTTFLSTLLSYLPFRGRGEGDEMDDDLDEENFDDDDESSKSAKWKKYQLPALLLLAVVGSVTYKRDGFKFLTAKKEVVEEGEESDIIRPDFVFEHPYISSSYYTSTQSLKTLQSIDKFQVSPKKEQLAGKKVQGQKDFTRETKTRLAILRPFCAFDAGPLPTTFDCWQSFPPCRAAAYELGDEFDADLLGLNDENKTFDDVGSHMLRNAKADVFLFYSQTFSENEVAIKSVDTIIDQYFEGGGWAQCFDNIYAVEANIPADLDNYIPPMQGKVYSFMHSFIHSFTKSSFTFQLN